MNRQNLDRQWDFELFSTSQGTCKTIKDRIDLPHDFSILQARDPHTPLGEYYGFFPGGVAEYRKTLFVPEESRGKKLLLEFEGVYMNATVRINRQIIAKHPYGYTSFHCDLTPYLRYGRDNCIHVTVNNSALAGTRWYSGSGIYRHVWLLTGGELHIPPWGVYITFPEASSRSSSALVRTSIENTSGSASGIVLRSTLLTPDGLAVAREETPVEIEAGKNLEVLQSLTVSPASLWSVETPYLYTLRSEIVRQGTVIDSTDTRAGIRSISFDPQHGFRLNGISMKLKGACVHHDCGLLGSASYDRAEERKVELLKANGFNAIRCAHNPPSPHFLDACDRLGMLVIDEAFDCWREAKTPNDYSLYFEEWWQRDLSSMVLRDRNHPCIIMWSTGNEIPERDGSSEGYAYAARLAAFVRSLDDTRAVTNCLCGIRPEAALEGLAANVDEACGEYDHWGELSRRYVEPLDVVGYNYMLSRYESDGKKFPGRVICATETMVYEAYDYWETVQRLPHVIGEFIWTGLDYLGESGLGHVWYNDDKSYLGKYPWHQAHCGDIDICGFKRPQSYYRDCVWGLSTTPYLAVYPPEVYGKTPRISKWGWPDVVSSWTWPGYEGMPAVVDVYCSCPEVELLLNGKSLGCRKAGKEHRYIASFEVFYEPGELKAIGYDKGVPVSSAVLKTSGPPASLRLTPDRVLLKASFGDLSYITVEVLDSAGNTAHNARIPVRFTVCGPGILLAVGTGNPTTEEMYTGDERKTYEGQAMAVIRTSGEIGEITVTASAGELPTATIVLRVG